VIPPEPSALLPQAAACPLIPAPRITLYARPFSECGGLPAPLQGEARRFCTLHVEQSAI